MMNKKEKMMKIAHDVFWGKGDTDHPSCPECGSTMNFFGGDDVPFGGCGMEMSGLQVSV